MKISRTLLAALMIWASVQVTAQNGRFGYIDFNGTLKLMPDYIEAESVLHKIQNDYRDEIERSKREFERQYVGFMLEQEHLSASIIAKRQKELQLLMDNNAEFRDRVQEELEAKRRDLVNPLRKKLLDAIAEVCVEKDLDYVVDTGAGTYLYINEERSVDISVDVFNRVGIEKLASRLDEETQYSIEPDSEEPAVLENEEEPQVHDLQTEE